MYHDMPLSIPGIFSVAGTQGEGSCFGDFIPQLSDLFSGAMWMHGFERLRISPATRSQPCFPSALHKCHEVPMMSMHRVLRRPAPAGLVSSQPCRLTSHTIRCSFCVDCIHLPSHWWKVSRKGLRGPQPTRRSTVERPLFYPPQVRWWWWQLQRDQPLWPPWPWGLRAGRSSPPPRRCTANPSTDFSL